METEHVAANPHKINKDLNLVMISHAMTMRKLKMLVILHSIAMGAEDMSNVRWINTEKVKKILMFHAMRIKMLKMLLMFLEIMLRTLNMLLMKCWMKSEEGTSIRKCI